MPNLFARRSDFAEAGLVMDRAWVGAGAVLVPLGLGGAWLAWSNARGHAQAAAKEGAATEERRAAEARDRTAREERERVQAQAQRLKDEAARAAPARARNTLDVIRALHPVYCKTAAARAGWEKCHDEERGGVDAMIACAGRAQNAATIKSARAVAAPIAHVENACGRLVEESLRRVIAGAATGTAKEIAWMTTNREKLRTVLAGKTFSEGCVGSVCDGKPDVFGETALDLEKLRCTAEQFLCDNDPRNVCLLSKVADRLSVGCDPPRGKPGFLVERVSGKTIE